MEIRGDRRCRDCGARWSYFETEGIVCPECESPHSVAAGGEARLHTDRDVEIDLTPLRRRAGNEPTEDVTDEIVETCREYIARRGFVRGGDLLALDDVYLAVVELRYAAAFYSPRMDETAESYLLSLLQGAEAGERPESVPAPLNPAIALARAEAVDTYRRELVRILEDYEDPALAGACGSLVDHVRRVRALDGDVPLADTERLVTVAREIGSYLNDEDETALARAQDRLERLDGG